MSRRTLSPTPFVDTRSPEERRIQARADELLTTGDHAIRRVILGYVASPMTAFATVTGAHKRCRQKWLDVDGSHSIEIQGRTALSGCSFAFSQTLVTLVRTERLDAEFTTRGVHLRRGVLFPTDPSAFAR